MRKLLLTLLLAAMYATGKAQSQCVVTHFDEFSGMAQWYVTQIVQDKSGMLWFATWNGLNRYDGYQFECFKSQVGDGVDMPSDRIRDMLLNDDGNLWCYIDKRVFLFDTRTCQYHHVPKQTEAALIRRFEQRHGRELRGEDTPYLYTDPYGVKWRIHADGTLTWYDKARGAWQPYYLEKPMKSPVAYCTTDSEGNVWLRSSYGAYQLTFKQPPYTFFPQQKPSMVRTFYIDRKQRYWITTKEDATVRLYSADNRLLGYLGRDGRLHPEYTSFGSPVYCVLQDSEGVFWLGSKPDGLFRLHERTDGVFDVEQFRHRKGDKNSLAYDHVFGLREDRLGRLWVSTFHGGLHCVEHPHEAQLTFLSRDNGLRLPKKEWTLVRQTYITDDDVMLVVTTSGLMVGDVSKKNVRDITWKCHTRDVHRQSSLSNNATMFVTEDSQHRLFVCTESGGVNEILSDDILADQLEFSHYGISTGFPSDVALSAVALDSTLLVVSNNQLIRMRVDQTHHATFDAFFWKDKLRFSDACPTQLPDGRWILGLQDGAFTIRPQDISKSAFVPPIALTGISVQNQPVARAVNQLDTLVLSPSERNFTVYFSALDYADNGSVSYAFLMRSGHGKEEWNAIGKDHSATLLDLRPGTYQLMIRSTNADGVWVDNARTLTVIVKPTFWETPWAKLLYLLALALIAWSVLYTRRYIQRINRQQRETHEAYLALLNERNASRQEEERPSPPADSIARLKPEDDAFMQRAVRFIEEHLSDPDINIGDMADATATSRSGLNRKMKSLLGVTPLDFIREARMRKACQMLQEGASVNDVAYACGFSDPKYFGKCFKADVGMTPTEYKSQPVPVR